MWYSKPRRPLDHFKIEIWIMTRTYSIGQPIREICPGCPIHESWYPILTGQSIQRIKTEKRKKLGKFPSSKKNYNWRILWLLDEPVEVQDFQNCLMSLLILNRKITEPTLIGYKYQKQDIHVKVQRFILSKAKVRARCWKHHRGWWCSLSGKEETHWC